MVARGVMEEEEEEEHGHCCWLKDKVLGFRVYPSNFLLHNPSKLVCHFLVGATAFPNFSFHFRVTFTTLHFVIQLN